MNQNENDFFDFERPVWICSKIVKTFIIRSSQYFKNEKAEITDFKTSGLTTNVYKGMAYLPIYFPNWQSLIYIMHSSLET